MTAATPSAPKAIAQNTRILVTGGAGFIGSHLVHRLVRAGYRSITVLDNMTRGETSNLDAVRESIRLFKVDIRSVAIVGRFMEDVDVVFHLAAQSSVMGSMLDLDYASSTNIVGTAVVLQTARAAGVRRIVFTSSREVYGEPGNLPVPETAPLQPKNVYGMTKVAGEMCCALSAGALEAVVLRLANVYGPGDYGRVIPSFINSALSDRGLVVYGGQQLLDFVHVDDVVEALIESGLGRYVGGPVNIGNGTGTTVLELAERILEFTSSRSPIIRQPSRDVEVSRFVADVSRSCDVFGISPRPDPLHGLPELIKQIARNSLVPAS